MDRYTYEQLQATAFDVTGGWLHNVIIPSIGFLIKWLVISLIFWATGDFINEDK